MAETQQQVLLVDPAKCSGCNSCMLICSFIHEGRFSMTKSRIRIWKDVDEGINVPIVCHHCNPAPCMAACPTGALFRDENGYVQWDEDKCIRCGQCVAACPFGAIGLEENGDLLKCDLCQGRDMPLCAKYCTAGALQWIEPEKVIELKLHEIGTKVILTMQEGE